MTRSPIKVNALPDDPLATEADRHLIFRTYEIARSAVAHGNHPFGALLAHDGKIVAEIENNVVTSRDLTMHAETRLIGKASRTLSRRTLSESTLYTSTEPCLMCCGAIYWAGVKRIVFGTSAQQMELQIYSVRRTDRFSSRELFRKLSPETEIIGPILEGDGLAIHASFWPEFLSKHPE